jgi:hypothetical protein
VIDTNFLQYSCCAILRMHNRLVRKCVNMNKLLQYCSLNSITEIAGPGCIDSIRVFIMFYFCTEFAVIKFTVLLSSAVQNSTASNERHSAVQNSAESNERYSAVQKGTVSNVKDRRTVLLL